MLLVLKASEETYARERTRFLEDNHVQNGNDPVILSAQNTQVTEAQMQAAGMDTVIVRDTDVAYAGRDPNEVPNVDGLRFNCWVMVKKAQVRTT